MPSVEIRDGTGRWFQIQSFNVELVGQWIVETLASMAPPPGFEALMPDIQVCIRPMWNHQNKSDWPPTGNGGMFQVYIRPSNPKVMAKNLAEIIKKFAEVS